VVVVVVFAGRDSPGLHMAIWLCGRVFRLIKFLEEWIFDGRGATLLRLELHHRHLQKKMTEVAKQYAVYALRRVNCICLCLTVFSILQCYIYTVPVICNLSAYTW
jgi:hypothetical protein